MKDCSIHNYSVIIPLAGSGSRFVRDGFTCHKSTLDINGRNMLQRIFDKFPHDPSFYIITTKEIYSLIEPFLDSIRSYTYNFIIIEPHKLGPAYTLYQSLDYLPDDTVSFLSYTDITWSWDDKTFLAMYSASASVACHKGFHPHLVNNNFSAFCRPKEQTHIKNSLTLDCIREKQSFTDDWMNEYLSIGLFQFSSLSLIKEHLHQMINVDNCRAAGEYFPSLLYNYICKSCTVGLFVVDSFVHYGEPSSYNDFVDHAYALNKLANIQKTLDSSETSYNSIVFASGTGTRMKTVSPLSKADIQVGNMTMLDHVYRSLPISPASSTLVVNTDQSLCSDSASQATLLVIPPTNSQFDSLVYASKKLKDLTNFFLCSCDCFADFDLTKLTSLIDTVDPDLILFGFEPSLLQNRLSQGTMSSFAFGSDYVTCLSVKSFDSFDNNIGLCGFFWLKSGSQLLTWINSLKCHQPSLPYELIIDHVFSTLDFSSLKVPYILVDKYYHLGTPQEYNEFLYWSSHFSPLTSSS
jgi:molybdopterin-guanine dinucleotide biosynthesis protein A